MDLIKEGFDPSKADDPLYILCDGVFPPGMSAMMDKITTWDIRL